LALNTLQQSVQEPILQQLFSWFILSKLWGNAH
jgi:hypothetical protein